MDDLLGVPARAERLAANPWNLIRLEPAEESMAILSDPANGLELARLARIIGKVRAARLRVHCITSPVAAERTANTLLALGVRPSLTVDAEEAPAFVTNSDALLINLGMLDDMRNAAIPAAIAAARTAGKPWVLDPVFTDVSPVRAAFARHLLSLGPTAVKANAAETGLLKLTPAGTVQIVTGAVDAIRYEKRSAELTYGSQLAAQVTAMGCALGAVVAAFLAIEPDPFAAAAAAIATYGVAAEQATGDAAGPGSFGIAIIDRLAALTPAEFVRSAERP